MRIAVIFIALFFPLIVQADEQCTCPCPCRESSKTSRLLGLWDQATETLTITRPTGQQIKVDGRRSILSGGQKVFGVETVGEEVHVLTGPKSNRTPNRRVRFNDGGLYKGTEAY